MYIGKKYSQRYADALEAGLYPSSMLSVTLGVKSDIIEKLMPPMEWHHASMLYNKVRFFEFDSFKGFWMFVRDNKSKINSFFRKNNNIKVRVTFFEFIKDKNEPTIEELDGWFESIKGGVQEVHICKEYKKIKKNGKEYKLYAHLTNAAHINDAGCGFSFRDPLELTLRTSFSNGKKSAINGRLLYKNDKEYSEVLALFEEDVKNLSSGGYYLR